MNKYYIIYFKDKKEYYWCETGHITEYDEAIKTYCDCYKNRYTYTKLVEITILENEILKNP